MQHVMCHTAESNSDIHQQALQTEEHDSIFFLDSCTTHTIIKDLKFFVEIQSQQISIGTIGPNATDIGDGYGPAILLIDDIRLEVPTAIYAPRAMRQLISFRDLSINQVNFFNERDMITNENYLVLSKVVDTNALKTVKCHMQPDGFYVISAKPTVQAITNTTNCSVNVWHARMGHPGITAQRRLVSTVIGLPSDFLKRISSNESSPCIPCYQGKLSIRSPPRISYKMYPFLYLIHVDLCGPIDPPCGPFRYFMIVVDSTSRYFEISLLSSKNEIFCKLLISLTKIRTRFPDFHIICAF